MKNLFALILYLFAFQIFGNAQTNMEIVPILRERVEVGRVNQSIVVSIIEEKGVRFTSLGKASRKPDAKNVDENTVFEIGSVTKVFTGTLLAEAVRRGEVKLDDPVSKYLPATVKTPTRNGIEITLLELATHTSGLPRLPANFAPKNNENPYADYSVEQMYDFLSKYELTRGGIGFIKAQKRGVVVLSNSTESVDDIGMNILDSRLPLKKIKPFVAVSEKLLDEYAGEYELAPSVIFTIVPKGGKLFAQLTGQPNIRVFAESENKFYYKVVNARLTFNRGAGGKIESLTLDQNGEHIAKKIK